MVNTSHEVIGFIRDQGGSVTDTDLLEHFDVLDDSNRALSIFRVVSDSIKRGLIERIPSHHPIIGGRLAVRLATDAIA